MHAGWAGSCWWWRLFTDPLITRPGLGQWWSSQSVYVVFVCGRLDWFRRTPPSPSPSTSSNPNHCTPCLRLSIYFIAQCACVFIRSSTRSSCLLPKINLIVFWHFPLRNADEQESCEFSLFAFFLLATETTDWLLTFNFYFLHSLIFGTNKSFKALFEKKEEGIIQ